jgi:hypothetical protein
MVLALWLAMVEIIVPSGNLILHYGILAFALAMILLNLNIALASLKSKI